MEPPPPPVPEKTALDRMKEAGAQPSLLAMMMAGQNPPPGAPPAPPGGAPPQDSGSNQDDMYGNSNLFAKRDWGRTRASRRGIDDDGGMFASGLKDDDMPVRTKTKTKELNIGGGMFGADALQEGEGE